MDRGRKRWNVEVKDGQREERMDRGRKGWIVEGKDG